MKKSRLRRVNPDTARENAAIRADRKAYAEEHGKTTVHEIVGGGSRHKTKKDRRFWLAVNDDGEHDTIQYESKAKQMARKLLQDGDYFDLDAVNEEYRIGGSEWPITFRQIAEHLQLKEG
jgi:hypothetical protein